MDKKTLIRVSIAILVVFILLTWFVLQPKEAGNKPKIENFVVDPENPLAKESFSIRLKATDDDGLQSIGFEVKGTAKKEYFNCSGKICEHIWQLEAPPREGTFTVTAFAVDSTNQKAEQQRVIQINFQQIPAEKCISGDKICPEGCTYEQDTDCKKPEEEQNCSSNTDCLSDLCLNKTLNIYSCQEGKCISSSKSKECCQNVDCDDQNSSTKNECKNHGCIYNPIDNYSYGSTYIVNYLSVY